MKDRVAGAPGQYKATITESDLQKMQAGEQFLITMVRDDQPIVEGTPYSKAAVLPDDVAKMICTGIEDPTPAEAFRSLAENTAPAGFVAKNYVISGATGTEEYLENILAKEYASMKDRTERHISIENNKDGLSLPRSTNLIYISKTDKNYGTFRSIGYSAYGVKLLARSLQSGNLKPWEWENPPMNLGVEYRTTDRYNGEPVYTQLVEFGSLPASTYKEKQFTTDYVTNVVDINAIAVYDGIYKKIETLSGVTDFSVKRSVNKALVTVTTNADLSQQYAYITLKYTKG